MKFLHQNIIAIIPASGKPTNKIMNNSNLPDTMLPINGKPVIGYIIEDLLKRSIKKAAVILNKDDNYTEKYITKKFGSKCALIIIYNDNYERGLGYSICLTKSHISESEGTLIYLGDTIYKGPLKFDSDFLVVSKKYESTEKWCFIEKEKNKLCFINKPQDYKSGGKILCGIYFFTDTKVLAKNFDRVEKSEENI